MTDIEKLADRLAIQDVLTRYARGIDRCDLEVLNGVWWPGTQADYGDGPVDAHGWCANVVQMLATMRGTQHFIANMLIEVDGNAATAETYCLAYHDTDHDGAAVELDVGGRYLDRLEKRDGEWRIANRRYVYDWSRTLPSTTNTGPIVMNLRRRGQRAPHDPSYTGA